MAADTDSHWEEDESKIPETELRKEKKREKKQKTEELVDSDGKDGTMCVRVEQIVAKLDKIPPIVAYFSSGYDPSCDKTYEGKKASGNSVPRVRVYRHTAENQTKRLQVVLSPPGSDVEFVGSNYTGEGATRQTCVYTLGVLDKETKTLKIVPIASNKIFRLEPKVPISKSAKDELSTGSGNAEITAVERAEKARKLNNLYGTKSAISRDRKRHSLNPGDNPDSKILLDEKLKEAVIKEAFESMTAPVARNIPPYNASARTPQEVYPLDQIILSGEWDFLDDVYKLLGEGIGASTEAYPTFVRNRIFKLRDLKDETEKKTLSCVFSFITHLIKFKDVHSVGGMSSAKHHKFPGIIRQRFKNMFEDSESNRLSTDKNYLLISYVLVLALYADGFRSDPADIAKDLRMTLMDLRKHFLNLGCESKVKLVTLSVPLKFPSIAQKRKRRR